MTHAELGAMIASARKAQGYTIRSLAEKVGLPHPTIVNIENGKLNAGVKIYLQLFDALNISIKQGE